MLTYYIAGYVARKTLKKTQCETCATCLTSDRNTATGSDQASLFTAHFDNGGLIYPSGPLKAAIAKLENSFTTYFSVSKLHEKSIVDFSAFLKKTDLPHLGCEEHSNFITKSLHEVLHFT